MQTTIDEVLEFGFAVSDTTVYNDRSSAIEGGILTSCSSQAPFLDCTAQSLIDACEELAEAADTALNTGTDVLVHDGVSTRPLGEGEVCDFELLGGDAGTGGDGDGGESGTGADSTGAAVGPFGDLEMLVDCDSTGQVCTLDRELKQFVGSSFQVFYDEGVGLRVLSEEESGYPGVVLSGLDAGEASTELADSLGLQDGDVVKTVNSITIHDEDDALLAANDLLQSMSVSLHVLRGERLVRFRYTISE